MTGDAPAAAIGTMLGQVSDDHAQRRFLRCWHAIHAAALLGWIAFCVWLFGWVLPAA
jgi:hypothetical protein